MTIQSFKDEHYKVSASDIAENGSDIEICDHALIKWKGLLPENMQKHGLMKEGECIVEKDNLDSVFSIDSDSCSLCKTYLDYELEHECEDCPIKKKKGRDCELEYSQWYYHVDPIPMINLLKEVRENLVKESKNEG